MYCSLAPRLSPACAHNKSRGEPGEFYHMSDVKGREDSLNVGGLMAAFYLTHIR